MDLKSKKKYLLETGRPVLFPRILLPEGRESTDYKLYAKNGTIPKKNEPGTTPRIHVAFRDTGHGAIHHSRRPPLTLWTRRRMQKLPPARRFHIAVHTRSHRISISSQYKTHRLRHCTRQPPGGFPWADEASREPPRGPASTTHIPGQQPGPCNQPHKPPSIRSLGRRQGRVQRHGARRHRQTRRVPVFLRSPSRAEEKQRMPRGDYRALNTRTIQDTYPVTHIQDYSHRISGCITISIVPVRAFH